MAGKGDRPRKMDGPKYRDNYDSIKWNKKKPIDAKKPEPINTNNLLGVEPSANRGGGAQGLAPS
jgi:hypothetical protein